MPKARGNIAGANLIGAFKTQMYLLYQAVSVILLPAVLLYWIAKMAWRGDYLMRLTERFGTRKIGQSFGSNTARRSLRVRTEPQAPLCFWVHAVSVGEVMAATPLIRGLQARFPGSRIVLSTITPAGRETAQKYCPDIDVVMYFPVDFFLIVDKVIARINPTVFLPVETDIWPTLVQRLSRRNVAMILVNGRVSLRRLKYRCFFRPIFRKLSFFCMQTEVDVERLIEMGVDRTNIARTGNMKFSQAISTAQSPMAVRLKLPSSAVLLIAGSTHEGEEIELLRCYHALLARKQGVYLLIAPRHLERLERLEKLVRAQGFNSTRWSRLDGQPPDSIILLDTMGELSVTYPLATAVFVGGSWVSRGGHNVLEPAASGKPVFFGPHMENYSSIATNLVRIGAAIQVQNGKDLAESLDRLLERPAELLEMGQRARRFVLENQDAVERNLEVIERFLRSGVDARKAGAAA
jgi:3-deoxy-D-manno-octulosonic-acid transferase